MSQQHPTPLPHGNPLQRRPAQATRRPRAFGGLLALLVLVPLVDGQALAGSATAESIWDRNDARQRARQQVPRGATVTDTQCEEITVASDFRYRCTVFYADPAVPMAPPEPSGAQPDPAHPRP